MELTWDQPNQYNTHPGSETFTAYRDGKLYTIFSMFGIAELTVVTSKEVVYKRTNLYTVGACKLVAETV
jgi:hypothetical protein